MDDDALANWIAEDWEISQQTANTWIEKHKEFLQNIKDTNIKISPGGFPVNSWIAQFFYAGRPTVIVAPNGEGKTYFASWIMKKAMITHKDWVFASNIPFYFFDERYEELRPLNLIQIQTLSGLLRLIAENIINKKKTAVVLDETEHFSSSHSWRDSNWIAFINISRHLMVKGPLLIYHATNLIPIEIRTGQIGNSVMPLMIHNGERYIASWKTKPHVLHISSSDVILPYSHLGWGGFNPDVDVIKLERDIVQIDIREAAKMIQKKLDKYIIGDKENPDIVYRMKMSEAGKKGAAKRWANRRSE